MTVQASSRQQFDDCRAVDTAVAVWLTGQQDHLTALADGLEYLTHAD